jgi:hypothetical protein
MTVTSTHMRVLLVLVLASASARLSESLVLQSKDVTRRTWWSQVVSSCATVGSAVAQPAFAISQEDRDKANILKGYQRLNYLIDNWEKETTVCNTSNDNPYLGCDRSPLKVMEYLGFKSTEDPLFKADKVLLRLQNLVPEKFEEEYQDAMDTWVGKYWLVVVVIIFLSKVSRFVLVWYTEKSEEGSGMAYISSWGESNPGGGKDRVALFIERSKKDVIACRDCLGTVIRVLELQ